MDPKMKATTILDCLNKAPLFERIPQEKLKRLADISSIKKVDKGAIIFTEGEQGHSLYVVITGNIVELVTGPNDLEMIVKDRKPYDYFGELSLLTDEPQLITAMATQASSLVVIPKNEFLFRARTEPSINQHIIKLLAQRLVLSARHQIAFLHLGASSRLAYLLLSLVEESGVIESSQEVLAQRCGLSRQTVARIIGEWKDAEWIKTSRGRIDYIDAKALKLILTMSGYDNNNK